MKKAINIVKTVLVWLLVAIAVAMMIFTVISVNTFDRNDRSLFGYKMYIVLSDSMSGVKDDPDHGGYFNAGDLVIVKEIDPSTLNEGDIVAYISTNTENYGQTVTHMIRSKTVDANGELGFITYGTATGVNDDNVVAHYYIQGKYDFCIPYVGLFFQFLKTTPGYIVCIFVPFLILIGIQGFNSVRLFKKYKAEQLEALNEEREKERAELDAERARIEEERKKQEEMMQKLLEMQEALQKNSGAASDGKKPETDDKTQDK